MNDSKYNSTYETLKDLSKPQHASIAMEGCGGRKSARSMIEDRVRRLRAEADGLEALLRALPMELPAQADDALRDVLCRTR